MSDVELSLERLVPAPPERVFALWTEPDQLVKWFGPDGYDIPEHNLDIRPGGAWRTVMRSPEGKRMAVSGVYRAVEKPRRLVFTWAWEDDTGARGHETEVTVTFAAVPGGTRLVIAQKEFPTQESRDQHASGWNSTLDCLARLVSGN